MFFIFYTDFFISILQVSVCVYVCECVCVCRSFASLGRFILKHFILFDAVVNGIIYLIFFF